MMTGWLESMLPLVKNDAADLTLDKETFEKGINEKGINNAVKDNDGKYPPD